MSSNDNIRENTGQSYLERLIEEVKKEDIPSASDSTPANASSDPISSLLSNPELLLKLPNIISSAKPILDILGSVSGQSKPPFQDIKKEETVPVFSGKSLENDRHTALLCAMKPYLNPERQKAIDYIIKLRSLGELLNGFRS